MDLRLDGVTWTSVSLDHALVFASDDGDELRVVTRLTVDVAATSVGIEPGACAELPPAAEALSGTVRAAATDPDGTLRMSVGDGTSLRVAPHADVEAWTLVRADGSRVASVPGGDLATWRRPVPRLERTPRSVPELRAAMIANGVDPLSFVCSDYDTGDTDSRPGSDPWVLWHHDDAWDVGGVERGQFLLDGSFATEAAACERLSEILLHEHPVYVLTEAARARSDAITERAQARGAELIAELRRRREGNQSEATP